MKVIFSSVTPFPWAARHVAEEQLFRQSPARRMTPIVYLWIKLDSIELWNFSTQEEHTTDLLL